MHIYKKVLFMALIVSTAISAIESHIETEKQTSTGPSTQKIKTKDWGSKFDAVKNLFGQITDDRAQLKEIRKEYTDKFLEVKEDQSIDMESFTKEIDAKNKEFVSRIIDEEVKSLDIDPTTFSVFTMGSMARGESGLYTDLEIFFVVKEKTLLTQYYMERLAQRLSDRFFRLGEHPDVGGKGMRVDEAGNSPFHLRFASRYMDPTYQRQVTREAIANRDFAAIPFEGCHMMLVTPEELAHYSDKPTLKKMLSESTPEERAALRQKRRADFLRAFEILRRDPAHAHKSDQEIRQQLAYYSRHLYNKKSSREVKHAEDLGNVLLRNCAPLYDKADMFPEYWNLREAILNSAAVDQPEKYATRREEIATKVILSDLLKYLTDLKLNIGSGNLGDTIDLKREVYRSIEQFMTNMGFYYNVGVQNCFEIIQALKERGIFDEAFAQDLHDIMNFAMFLNIKQQALMQKQGFAIYLSQEKYEKDHKELTDLENITQKKIDLLITANASAKEIAKFRNELCSIKKKIHDLEGSAPGNILSDDEKSLLAEKYIPMLKKLYEKAALWSGQDGEKALKGSLAD